MTPRPNVALWVAALAAIVVLSGCSLAGDVTPPPGSGAANLPPEAIDLGQGYPAGKPSAANGAQVYAAHCAQCHGAGGQGDGELAGQLDFPPANFTDPALARTATPAEWYAIVTQGRLARLMPPFANALSEAERWDAVAYLYTLGAPPDTTSNGQAIYEAECAACHGAQGAGDGPQADASAPPPDFNDLQSMTGLSQADLFSVISAGAGAAMPAYADTLTEDERWAVAAAVRAFTFEALAPVEDTATARGVVAGEVINGTLGGPVAGGLEVVLYGFDDVQLTTTLTGTVQADGSYLFEDVPYQDGRAFVVTTEYNGVPYASDIVAFAGGAAQLSAPVRVYETTTDPAALQIDRLHIFFDFAPGSATVGELLLLSNNGDRTVLGGGALQFDLPEGATNVRIEGLAAGQDFVETPEGFTLTRPIPPGANSTQLLVSFFLPYERGLDFAQTLPLPVETVNVLVPDMGVTASGAQLRDNGPQDLQGLRVLTYSTAALPAEHVLAFRLSGRGAASTPLVAVDAPGLVVGGLTLLAVLGGVGWWYYSRKPDAGKQSAPPANREALVRQIAALDDEHAAGRVAESDYRKRRAALKARLADMWQT